jgi:hypothetical protein
VFFATVSGKGPLPQLHPYRSQGKPGTEKPGRLYGQKRTPTKATVRADHQSSSITLHLSAHRPLGQRARN